MLTARIDASTEISEYYLLLTQDGAWYTGINTLTEARTKAVELGGMVEIFRHVTTVVGENPPVGIAAGNELTPALVGG